ncbi:unnamed protein product [Brassica rapa subsp. narinosa]
MEPILCTPQKLHDASPQRNGNVLDVEVEFGGVEFDVPVVTIKNGVVISFTHNKSFQVINMQSVRFAHPAEHTTTCLRRRKKH